jgi:hypothetical protein
VDTACGQRLGRAIGTRVELCKREAVFAQRCGRPLRDCSRCVPEDVTGHQRLGHVAPTSLATVNDLSLQIADLRL